MIKMILSKNIGSQKVSLIIPCYNEVKYISTFLDSLLNQELNGLDLEVLIADGMSNDGTREILKTYCIKNPQIKIVDNPNKIVSTGLNLAIRMSKGEIIIRMDVHTIYAPDYIYQCVNVLNETGADNVGGSWQAFGKSYIQKAIALAFQSSFSSGGASSHSTKKEGYVDSVYLGCWKKDKLYQIGLFDEELIRNQDDELNLRICKNSGKVWQSRKIKSWYSPRSSLISMFKQYMQYGYWKVRVIQKHKLPASIRHLVPGCFVAALLILLVLSPFSYLVRYLLFFLLGFYGIANILATFLTCRTPRTYKFIFIMPLIFGVYHFGYGVGFLFGILDFVLLQKKGRHLFSKLTR
jgi:glycosyltransferase involved in cell wall biosynthesis